MIKNIIFDLGGVLLDIDLPYCMKNVQALGIDFKAMSAQTSKESPATSTGMKPAVMGEGLVANGALHLYQIGEISTDDFLNGIQQLCHPGTTRQQVIDAWNTCCIGIPQYRLEKVKQLRQKGYRIHMLSNTNDAHWIDILNRCFGGQEIVSQLFDHVFLSQEMHMAKPNDDIYLQVLSTLQATAEECLFIDDSTPNIKAAATLGFHTIHAEVSQTHNGEVIAPPQNDWVKNIDDMLQSLQA